MTSLTTRFAIASGIAPSSPRPTSMRSLRSFLATTRIAPSAFERLNLCCGERAGEVGDARLERRHRDFIGGEREARQQEYRAGGNPDEPAPGHEGLLLRRGWRRLLAEIHLRRSRDRLLVLDAEVGLDPVAEHHRRQVDRKLAYQHVVFLHRLDVAVARDRDAVLRALELRLEVAKVRVRLELGIVFRNHEQPRKSARHARLRLLEAPERGFVV